MKSAKINFHKEFPTTPVSVWAGARFHAWRRENDATGHLKPIYRIPHPFPKQRKVWCLLEVHFDQVNLIFATPQELDQFIEVLSENPLPSGRALSPKCSVGRPHYHWLAKLPSKVKVLKFRKRLCAYLLKCEEASDFRSFYKDTPVRTRFSDFFDSHDEAREGRR
ncbi:hypothetical protein [Pseudophaeobacter sp.]|uniref:hypothetical protein n=1 Tax=Pseudophaeobacter sp. TaxID=1971739 RepID=UPI00329A5D80